MASVFDWQRLADPQAMIPEVIRRLRAGQVVSFPTDTSPCLAASGLAPAAVERLLGSENGQVGPLQAAVRGVADARDWVPGLPLLAQRLGRRFWPGPLTLLCREGWEEGLVRRVPEPVRKALCPDQALLLSSPRHEALLEVLSLLPGPLVLVPFQGERADLDGRADVIIEEGPGRPSGTSTLVEVKGAAWRVLQSGVLSEETLRQHSTCLIVFVCTGNTCRSPLAEALCKKRLSDRLGCRIEELPERGFSVVSAGLAALMGGTAADEAQAVAAAYGGDLTQHRSRPLTPDLAAQADYLIVMTRGHAQALFSHYPRLGCRPRLLRVTGDDLADPIGQSREVYEACGRQIWEALERLLQELVPESRTDPADAPSSRG